MTTVVNLRLEHCDVKICRGTPFGNPYTHLELSGTKAQYKVASREEAINMYRVWFQDQLKLPEFLAKVKALRGKRLGCYCHPLPCHGDVIVEWLNKHESRKRSYLGLIEHLKPGEVFVFGSNLDGFHGAGSAGYASFGVVGNHWREFDYASKPNGWKGKWNVKGVAEGMQVGTEGASYAIPTVTKAGAKRSRTPEQIKESIHKLYMFARSKPELDFLVAQENKMGLNGYTPQEMAEMFNCEEIPDNVVFEEGFTKLL